MKNKLMYLIRMSFGRKVKTKWFLAANILLALGIIAAMNIDTIITSFGGDFNEQQTIYVIDESNVSYDILNEQIKKTESVFITDQDKDSKKDNDKFEEPAGFVLKKMKGTEKDLKKKVKDTKKSFGIIIKPSKTTVLDITMVAKDYLNVTDSQKINVALNSTKSAVAIYQTTVDMEEVNKIYEPVKLKTIYLDAEKSDAEANSQMVMGIVFPVIILPFFMLTLFLVQMIGAEVNDEKTTRGMEIIISNVSPKVHFFSKVIAGNLFVILQGVLLMLYSGVGLLIRMFIGGDNIAGGIGSTVGELFNTILTSGMGEKLLYVIPLTLLLMVITFVAYSLLAGILASMTTTIEDFQQLQTPIIVISLVGYYLAIMSGMFGGSILIKICSYIPLISAILSPALLMTGEIAIIDIIISIVLVVITNFVLIKYGLKIYKVGILNYSAKGLWKKMFKALKD